MADIDRLKTEIDLNAFVAAYGFAEDPHDRWHGHTCFRNKAGDKIYVHRHKDGHWLYKNMKADNDKGTIVDFAMHHAGAADVRDAIKVLRDWQGVPHQSFPSVASQVTVIKKDRAAMQRRYMAMRVALRHPYLEDERGVPAMALQHWRFAGRVKIDGRGNAIFPHFDADGLCGYELKNHNFTGFASGATKGLWLSKSSRYDRSMVIAESAIDAISFSIMNPDGWARYASIGGAPSAAQLDLLRMEIAHMPARSEIVAAMDNDAAGRKLAELVRSSCGASLVQKLAFRQREPDEHKDWNDALRDNKSPTLARPRVLNLA